MEIENIINESFDNFLSNNSDLITELKQPTYKYGCVMLYYNVTKTWWDSVQNIIDNKDVVRVKGVIGREKYRDVHVTCLYGLHKNVTTEDVKEKIIDIPVRNVITNKVTYFETPESDVIKFDMDYEFFKKLNKSLKKLDFTPTHPRYSPHMTICYVKKGKGKEYCDLLNGKFKRTLRPTHFIYSTSKGEKIKIDFEQKI